MPPTVLLVDLTNLAVTAWHGFRGNVDLPRYTVDKICSLERNWRTDSVQCALDSSALFRRELDPSYKADRKPRPEGLDDALSDTIHAAGKEFETFGVDGYEADDVLATLARRETESSNRAIILSSDKDLRQCLVEHEVTICDRWRGLGETHWLTAARLLERYGVRPCQWIDWQCLVGDTSDGIRGADGIGEKTATRLLQSATLDELLADPWRRTSVAERESLFEFRSRVDLVRQLVTLRTDVTIMSGSISSMKEAF